MIIMNKKFLLPFVFLLFCIVSFAQNVRYNDSLSLEKQVDFIIEKSNNYKQFKVVNKVWLTKLLANTKKEVKQRDQNVVTLNDKIKTQAKSITDLESKLSTTNLDLEKSESAIDNMVLFGISMKKGVYNTVLWSIILGLIALTAFFAVQFKVSNKVTKESKKRLEEMETEFDEHRKRALEREQKVMRKLQDEINKNKQL